MAMIANTAFEARVTNGHFDETLNITGRFHNGSGNDEICPAGFLCVRGDKMPVNGFSAYSVYNENAYYMSAAASTATAEEPVYAANPYDWQLIPAGDEAFAEGVNTLGLPILSGREGTFTRIVFDGANIYRFGEGNVDGTVGANEYFTIDAGLLKPAAAAPTDNGALYFKIVGTGNFTEGINVGPGYYDVMAYAAVAAGSGDSLPEVSASDNGDVLTVVEGAWAKAAPSGGVSLLTATETVTEVNAEQRGTLDKTAAEIQSADIVKVIFEDGTDSCVGIITITAVTEANMITFGVVTQVGVYWWQADTVADYPYRVIDG